ncbi:MAG: Rrf2 family transcriptional regulator [Rhodospirillales bacterium]|jgi:Rrf2 family protein|nr:Rrf2 family transcriptional regulator [Rhodospirillales bacterium]
MITQRSKYALRALLMLAQQPDGQLVLISEIAERENVPKKFLELILLELKRHGLLRSQRGRNGGYGLAKAANTITFGEIIRITDGPLAPIPCASLSGYQRCTDCADESSCAIRMVMRRVRDAMSEVLDRTTLADGLASSHEAEARIASG